MVIGPNNELLSDGTWNYSYNTAGQQTGKTNIATGETWAYTYNLNGQLLTAVQQDADSNVLQTINYQYDAFGRILQQDVTGPDGVTQVSRYAYNGDQLYAVLDGNGNLVTRYLYAPGTNQLLGSVNAQGQFSSILTDPFGSVRDVVNPDGSISHIDYDAFGNLLDGSANPGLFGWNGMQLDSATGQYQGSAAREYDPVQGGGRVPIR